MSWELPTHLEYIVFNFIVLAGPVFFSFDRNVRYVRHWPQALAAAGALLPLFIVWDVLVTGRHWWFNSAFTGDTFVGNLPLGEWLFFISVPFASLFIWEIFRYYRPEKHQMRQLAVLPWIWLPGLTAAAGCAWFGKEYTALVCLAVVLAWTFDAFWGGRVMTYANIWPYFAILTVLMFLFNGYLTARPVVIYDPAFQLDIRLFTIPVEDFVYGYSLLLGCTSVYEKIRRDHA